MSIFIIIGEPGIGKTTAIMFLARMLRERELKVGGIVSRELRKDNLRVGFEFVDIITDRTALLASIHGTGLKVGKYSVNLEGCAFAVQVLRKAMVDADIIVCDELGPMEFKSKEFVNCVQSMLNIDKRIVAVVHKKLKHPVIDQFREKSALRINVDIQNRNKVPFLLLDRLV